MLSVNKNKYLQQYTKADSFKSSRKEITEKYIYNIFVLKICW